MCRYGVRYAWFLCVRIVYASGPWCLYLHRQRVWQIMLTITASESVLPFIKRTDQPEMNLRPALCAASDPLDGRTHSETKTRWQTGAMERGPWEETYPRGARGWADWAQAAMETKPAGATSHCLLIYCISAGRAAPERSRETERKKRAQRHIRSEKGRCFSPNQHYSSVILTRCQGWAIYRYYIDIVIWD